MSSIRSSRRALLSSLPHPRAVRVHSSYQGLPCQSLNLHNVHPTGKTNTNSFKPTSVPSRAVATFTAPHQAQAISTIQTFVDTSSHEFRENQHAMDDAMARLTELSAKVAEGGPQKARDKHLARNKMLPRDRVTALVDPGTTFMELSPLAGHELYPEADVPAGGIITGVGVVEGVNCMIVANDSTVKGGTYYPITVKKHLRAQAVAQENKLPYASEPILGPL